MKLEEIVALIREHARECNARWIDEAAGDYHLAVVLPCDVCTDEVVSAIVEHREELAMLTMAKHKWQRSEIGER